MVLTLYKMDASPPVRAVLMTIEALKIPDVNYIEVNLLKGDHLKEEFIKHQQKYIICENFSSLAITVPEIQSGDRQRDGRQIIPYPSYNVSLFYIRHKINPQHTIPMLLDDDFAIWDSHAIGSYLIHTYGGDDSLYPTDPKKRALVDQRLHFDSGVLFPAMRGAAEKVLFQGETSFGEESLNKIQSAYDFTDKFLTLPWLAGDQITLADICCVSTISSMNIILPIDKDRYENLWQWLQRCSQLEIYKTMNEPGLKLLQDLIASKIE